MRYVAWVALRLAGFAFFGLATAFVLVATLRHGYVSPTAILWPMWGFILIAAGLALVFQYGSAAFGLCLYVGMVLIGAYTWATRVGAPDLWFGIVIIAGIFLLGMGTFLVKADKKETPKKKIKEIIS